MNRFLPISPKIEVEAPIETPSGWRVRFESALPLTPAPKYIIVKCNHPYPCSIEGARIKIAKELPNIWEKCPCKNCAINSL